MTGISHPSPDHRREGAGTPAATILLVTWNGWPLLQRTLASIPASVRPGTPLDVLVMDNGSTDGTPERLAAEFPDVRCVPLPENLGFARANNLGVEEARAERILLLNNDTILEQGAVTALLEAADAHPEFDIFAPEMRQLAAPDRVDNRGIWLDATGHFRQLDSGRPVSERLPRSEVFGASGGACLIRQEVIRRIGLFDESLESYLEDCDFAARARAHGFRCLYVPESVVLHEGSATGERMAAHKYYLIQRNMLGLWRRWIRWRPWRLHPWLGGLYESLYLARALRDGRLALYLRAKRDAARYMQRAPGRERLARWIGVRTRPLSGPGPRREVAPR